MDKTEHRGPNEFDQRAVAAYGGEGYLCLGCLLLLDCFWKKPNLRETPVSALVLDELSDKY